MRISKRERAQIVELLRCAADLLVSGRSMFPRLDAARYLDIPNTLLTLDIIDTASEACADVGGPRNQFNLLEAAARVELGEWP